MLNRISAQNPEDPHTDLLATLAASRELGPEMDAALVESYLRKHPMPAERREPPTRTLRLAPDGLLAAMSFVAVAAIFVTAMVLSGGHAFWLFWLPLVVGGWWWRWRIWRPYGHWSHRVEAGDTHARHLDEPDTPARQ